MSSASFMSYCLVYSRQSRIIKNLVSSYIKQKSALNLEGLVFPFEPKSIPKFEKQNPKISVNVYSLDSDNRGFSIQYLSPERDREHHMKLLLLDDGNKRRYVWISNMLRLAAGRTNHNGATRLQQLLTSLFYQGEAEQSYSLFF